MSLFKDFRDFALRGNVLELAVGIAIGLALAELIRAVVDSILMPIIGILTGGMDFRSKFVRVGPADLRYGMFIQATIVFVIIAFFLFLIVKFANKVKLKTPVSPTLSSTDSLLIKISDQLAEINKSLSK